jgi:NADH dehydrogenase
MPAQLVTVFGGTGFLGRRIVRHLHDASFTVRIASRHPRAVMSFPDAGPQLRSVHGDINEDKSVIAAIDGAFAVVNAVSLY